MGIDQLNSWLAMIDPALCEPRTAKHWTAFTWGLFRVLINPAVVLPILFSIILLPWFVRSLRKWRIRTVGFTLLLLYGLVCSPAGMALGNQVLMSLLPQDTGQPTDAIVVLGRGKPLRPERVQVAAELWQANRAPLVFASGWGDAKPIARSLVQRGVAEQAVDGEPCSRTTEENAQFTAALLQPRGVRQILLVTDPPHMLRSFLTFQSFGFQVVPHPNPLPPEMNTRREAFLIVREYLGLMSYGLLGRFFPREVPPAEIVAQEGRSLLPHEVDRDVPLASPAES
jgi:uncharacterized SAM-binding protein YcdF (DUF218 family)